MFSAEKTSRSFHLNVTRANPQERRSKYIGVNFVMSKILFKVFLHCPEKFHLCNKESCQEMHHDI